MTYRIVRVPMTDRPGKFVMEGGKYIGELVPVQPDGEPLMTFEEWRQAVNPDGIDLQEAIDIYDLRVGEETP